MVHDGAAQHAISRSVILFIILNFTFAGLMAGLSSVVDPARLAAQSDVPAPLLLACTAGLALIVWLFRFQLLPVMVALGVSPPIAVEALYKAGVGLSLRVMLMWMFLSVPAVFLMGLASEVALLVTQTTDLATMPGYATGVLLLFSALVSTTTAVLQSFAGAHALRFCVKGSL